MRRKTNYRDRITPGSTWDIKHLRDHLQAAVDLEFWTIPFYMAAMYSIRDPASAAYGLTLSVVNQEMFHVQLAANVANAYGCDVSFQEPKYDDADIPHIRFQLDDPNPTTIFHPYSAEIGPFDERRLNAMCLIEYPEWDTSRTPDRRERTSEYGSIGEFYQAVRVGMSELRGHVRGDRNQVNHFERFYQNFPHQTVTRDGDAGFQQALALVDAIVEQGEGQTQGDADVPREFVNTADGLQESWPHFRKFKSILDSGRLPEVYAAERHCISGAGVEAQQILAGDFQTFRATLKSMFAGEHPQDFGVQMFKLGGDILRCWQNGAIPRFAAVEQARPAGAA
jgi:hypothetical protein